MFQLTNQEWAAIRSQTVTASSSHLMRSQIVTSYRRKLSTPAYAFTEQGIAMLSSVLRSPRAVQVNIAIMRTFVELRRLIEQFAVVFGAIKRLIADDEARRAQPGRRIGFTWTAT
jgi:hypothetical protein